MDVRVLGRTGDGACIASEKREAGVELALAGRMEAALSLYPG